MPDNRDDGQKLDRFWNELVAGRGNDRGDALAPGTSEAIRAFQTLARTRPTAASRDRVDREVFAAIEGADTRRHGSPADELAILPSPDRMFEANGAGKPVALRAVPRRRAGWEGLGGAALAAAALVLLTLVGSVVGLGSRPPWAPEASPAFLAAPAAGPIAELVWQAGGDATRPFASPTGAAIDARGNIWITDGGNDRIVILAPGGKVISPEGVILETWGTPGSGEGEFNFSDPTCQWLQLAGIAFDAAGNIYVADSGNHRIQKFAPDRTFLASWGSANTAEGQPFCPLSVALDGQGRVYVSDHLRGAIEVFDTEGRLLAAWAVEPGKPEQIALDGEGNVWVSSTSKGVLKFSPEGDLLAAWDTSREGDGGYNAPMGVAVDAQGRVFVSGQGARVQVFSPQGEYLGGWGAPGVAPGQFIEPAHLVLDGQGNVYTVDLFGHHVQKWRLAPAFAP